MSADSSLRSLIQILLITVLCSTIAQPQADVAKQQLAQQVRAEFLHAWNSYKKYAWSHDELKPLSKSYRDWYEQSLLNEFRRRAGYYDP